MISDPVIKKALRKAAKSKDEARAEIVDGPFSVYSRPIVAPHAFLSDNTIMGL